MNRVLYLSHFTPSMMAPETLEAIFVNREPILKRLVASVVTSALRPSKRHHLLVGPRGIGKTHLISLIHHRLGLNANLPDKVLLAWMREEEWGVTNFFELVIRILRTLNNSYPELKIDELTYPIYDLNKEQAEQRANEILLSLLRKKTLIIFLENIDDLFLQLGDMGQKQLRGFIQNHPQFVFVATTPALFSGVSAQKSAFYGFFDIEVLDELEFDDAVDLLAKIATERNDAKLTDFIRSHDGRARIRALHHLAEGNPRIYIIFAQFLTQESLDELVQAFMHTLDELTPYYQSRMKELSGQQRKLIEYLIQYKGAAQVKQIAKSCFITQQVCSSQLKQLRDKRYVRSIEQGRESYYELSEPLMRLCMDVKNQRGEPLALFVEMLRIWYTEEQLVQKITYAESVSGFAKPYLEKALEISKADAVEPHVSIFLKSIQNALSKKSLTDVVKEFSALRSKNVAVQTAQNFFRIVNAHRLEFDSIEDVSEEVLRVRVESSIELAELFAASFWESKYFRKFLVVNLLQASANTFRHSPKISALFKPLIYRLFAKSPSTSSIALFQTEMLEADKWLAFILEMDVSVAIANPIRALNKYLGRILSAATDYIENENASKLYRLPREERKFVELLYLAHKKMRS